MESSFHRALLLFSLILVSSSPTFGSTIGNSIEWVNATNSELFLMNLEPAGIENGVHLLLCRAFHYNLWMSGKLYTIKNNISCLVPHLGLGHAYTEYQVLSAPRGSTSWIPHPAQSSIPHNAIVSGDRPAENRLAHVCRTYHAPGKLIVGKFAVGVCWYEFGGREYSKTNKVEILVVNEYGQAIGANKAVKA